MAQKQDSALLGAVLDSWDRNCRALINLLRLIPVHALDARVREGSPTVSQMFSHMHHERMVSVLENAPECAGDVPEDEWKHEGDPDRLAEQLGVSARRVRDAVVGRVEADRPLDRDYAHPIQLLQFLTFHEGYHHGQIRSALKSAGCPIADDDAGPVIWDVWKGR